MRTLWRSWSRRASSPLVIQQLRQRSPWQAPLAGLAACGNPCGGVRRCYSSKVEGPNLHKEEKKATPEELKAAASMNERAYQRAKKEGKHIPAEAILAMFETDAPSKFEAYLEANLTESEMDRIARYLLVKNLPNDVMIPVLRAFVVRFPRSTRLPLALLAQKIGETGQFDESAHYGRLYLRFVYQSKSLHQLGFEAVEYKPEEQKEVAMLEFGIVQSFNSLASVYLEVGAYSYADRILEICEELLHKFQERSGSIDHDLWLTQVRQLRLNNEATLEDDPKIRRLDQSWESFFSNEADAEEVETIRDICRKKNAKTLLARVEIMLRDSEASGGMDEWLLVLCARLPEAANPGESIIPITFVSDEALKIGKLILA